jgi:tetratricopeptide (TPR) repeat protein
MKNMPTTITVSFDKDRADYAVSFAGMMSHRISQAQIDNALVLHKKLSWQRNLRDANALGTELFRMIDGSGGRLQQELNKAKQAGESPELYLNLPPELDILAFELMFHNGFLVLNHGVNIFRLISDKGKARQVKLEKRPLKTLFMACSPQGEAALQVEHEEEQILQETEKLHLHLDVEDSGSVDGLSEMITAAGGFDVVHLSGHAGIDDTLGPVFCMEDDTGETDPVTPIRLWEAIRAFPPRILFLSGCSTGKAEIHKGMASFTGQMVSFGIPFVMGWAEPVTDVGAIRMAVCIFKYLAMGKRVSEAVNAAREATVDSYRTWALFRMYSDASPAGAVIASGQGLRTHNIRKTIHKTLSRSSVRVLEQGFVGRRRQIQQGVRVLRGTEYDRSGILITGTAGIGKSCLSGKLIERFSHKKLIVIHGKLDVGDLFIKFNDLFEQYDIQSGLDIISSQDDNEKRVMAFFRDALKLMPSILYFDDFEQNLERVPSANADDDDVFKVHDDVLPLIRGLLRALNWAEGNTHIIISSRYPFELVHAGKNLPEEYLHRIPLMSMRDADLKKKLDNLAHIQTSRHKEAYIQAGKGNPRLLEWLDAIAAEEEKYDIERLKQAIEGKTEEYIARYLTELMINTEGEEFKQFLRQASVYRQPVPESAFADFDTPVQIRAQIQRGCRLTLIEQEIQADKESLYQVNPMIRESEWNRLSEERQKSAQDTASRWYDNWLENEENHSYTSLTEGVYHALTAKRIRQACGHAIDLGQLMKKMQLYYGHAAMQQEVANQVSDEVIAEAIREKDGNVAVLMNELGQAYQMLGDYPNVIRWTEKALEIKKGIFGENYSTIAIQYNNLGSAYQDLGEYEKAIEFYQRALDIDRKNFGENHPKIAIQYNNLGSAYNDLGEYEKAIEFYNRALDIDRKNFGENHPKIAIRYNNLGEAYNDLGEYEKAIEFYQRALDILRNNFGENHPQIAICNNNLGAAYESLGEYEKAIEFYERSLEIDRKFFDDNHPGIKITMKNLEIAKQARSVKFSTER